MLTFMCTILAFYCSRFGFRIPPGPGFREVDEINILPTLSSNRKNLLIESGVIASTDAEITPERLRNQIDQRRRQFTLFAAPDAKALSADISLVVAQYDEVIPLPGRPAASGDLAEGRVTVLLSEEDDSESSSPSLS